MSGLAGVHAFASGMPEPFGRDGKMQAFEKTGDSFPAAVITAADTGTWR
jgi:hypothetical protein